MEVDCIYDADLKAIIQLGNDMLDDDELVANKEALENDTTREDGSAPSTFYYDWQGYVNGVKIKNGEDKITDGAKIEWKWEQFKIDVEKNTKKK